MVSSQYKLYAFLAMIFLIGISWVGSDNLWAGFVKTQAPYSAYPPVRGQQPAIRLGHTTPHQPSQFSELTGVYSPLDQTRHMSVRPEEKLNILPAFSRIISEVYREMEP